MCPQLFKDVSLRAWFAAFALAAFGLVGVGMQLQEIYRLAPCPLCILQRFFYLLIGTIALLGWAFPRLARLWAGLMLAVALVGLVAAGYQSWLQAFPHLAAECSYTDPGVIERFVDWLSTLHSGLFLATGFCAARDWIFLWLSMANWSVLVFAGYTVSAWMVMRCRRN